MASGKSWVWNHFVERKSDHKAVCQFEDVNSTVKQDIGRFILREGPFKAEALTAEAYWQQLAISSPRLAKVALRVLSIAPSEAAVERAFSHRKLIHSNIHELHPIECFLFLASGPLFQTFQSEPSATDFSLPCNGEPLWHGRNCVLTLFLFKKCKVRMVNRLTKKNVRLTTVN